MEFSTEFYKDEVRNGFYIPTAIKQAWAANLSVLFEIDRICEKHGIRYFADWGSVLGAVRHGGYVPWDDDLDVCMLRDDYTRFREVAPAELPPEFEIQDYASKENHRLMLSRVVSEHKISFDEEHLRKYHNFPYISVVDVFVQDYLYKDPEQERARCEEVKQLLAVADGVMDHLITYEAAQIKLHEFETRYGVKFPKAGPWEKAAAGEVTSGCSAEERALGVALYRLAEQQMSRVPKEESDTVGQIFPWIMKGQQGKPKRFYEKTVRLPFENTTIPVPACYNEILRSKYGNYLEIRKVWDGHDYPYFEGQRRNLQKVADFALPEFTFSEALLDRGEMADAGNSLKGLAGACLEQLDVLTKEICEAVEHGAHDAALASLPEAQQLAVDLGTMIEEVKGENRPSTVAAVSALQDCCDAVFALYSAIAEPGEAGVDVPLVMDLASALAGASERVVDAIRSNVIDIKEILFLPVGGKEWRAFQSVYEDVVSRSDTDVYVVPLPLLFKDMCGHVTMTEEEIAAAAHAESYPEDLELTSWSTYDLSFHMPDEIWIQNPYDAENPCLTVPAQLYASVLIKYTPKLCYVPIADVAEFSKEDVTDLYNLKHYVTAPGVIRADRVWVQSENMREQYVERLTAFSGEMYRATWEEKICVRSWDLPVTSQEEQNVPPAEEGDNTEKPVRKKRLLYCIGLNEISENPEIVVDAVESRLWLFEENSERILPVIGFYPPDLTLWEGVDAALTKQLSDAVDTFITRADCERCDIRMENYETILRESDAYYGSASPLVPMFTQVKKPVMVSDYQVEV